MTAKSRKLPISLKRKLSDIQFENNLRFDGHVHQICKKLSLKISALSRAASDIDINQHNVMKAFSFSRVGYCSLDVSQL